jgi:voltage-gated potassium channel
MRPVSAKAIGLTFLIVLVCGTFGYRLLEGWSLLDSLYMTVITITTVGFGEIQPLSDGGKIFTLVLIFFGFGTAVLALSNLSFLMLRGELYNFFGRHRMQTELKKLSGHYILAGYGRMGKTILNQMKSRGAKVVVIDDSDSQLEELQKLHPKVIAVKGDASDEDTLKRAGIERAKGLVCVISSDADNAFAIMTARRLNPELRIVSRSIAEQSKSKLKFAGAQKVISPYDLGGTRIAQAILNPTLVDFVELVEEPDLKEIDMAEVEIAPGCALDGATLDSPDVKNLKIIIVGIKRQDGDLKFQPKGSTKIQGHDRLIFVAPTDQVTAVAKIAKHP